MKEAEQVATLWLAGTYVRDVGVSIERVWENVFDWEHLDHLHDGSFAGCQLLDRRPDGWRVRLVSAGLPERGQLIELRADRAHGSYTVTTLEGFGAGTEVRTRLTPIGPDRTGVHVQFHVPEKDPERLAAIGAGYRAAYARLWDEDEAMMQRRAKMLARSPQGPGFGPTSIDLGVEDEVRECLPLIFELGRQNYRLILLDSELVAHATVCPHWLGPLDEAPVIAGEVRCPWHGYGFDIPSGRCTTGQPLTLAAAPDIAIVDGRIWATLNAGASAV